MKNTFYILVLYNICLNFSLFSTTIENVTDHPIAIAIEAATLEGGPGKRLEIQPKEILNLEPAHYEDTTAAKQNGKLQLSVFNAKCLHGGCKDDFYTATVDKQLFNNAHVEIRKHENRLQALIIDKELHKRRQSRAAA